MRKISQMCLLAFLPNTNFEFEIILLIGAVSTGRAMMVSQQETATIHGEKMDSAFSQGKKSEEREKWKMRPWARLSAWSWKWEKYVCNKLLIGPFREPTEIKQMNTCGIKGFAPHWLLLLLTFLVYVDVMPVIVRWISFARSFLVIFPTIKRTVSTLIFSLSLSPSPVRWQTEQYKKGEKKRKKSESKSRAKVPRVVVHVVCAHTLATCGFLTYASHKI